MFETHKKSRRWAGVHACKFSRLTNCARGETSAVSAAPASKQMEKTAPQVDTHDVFLAIRWNGNDEMRQKRSEVESQILPGTK